ncbi:conserved hypothetical protein [Candida tropicalis MYA-3404]|uniref:Uncharacterized protein n=1 Tax=Candida tropicalis (strain ATCC MYA-3404 / T1) TaxID=294747 RepID=C5MG60_CANTT|nr:conserved hypothetical protein [Candida tropicalis MYA-3404]EER31323.1 conserved hypothetical protein [Candida tropicalis MYA-3404]KAG4404892.1 hypothetical protein JTP64_005906 [Candida tropicalis]
MSVSTTTTTTTTSSEDKTGNPGLVSTSDALIAFSDHILEQIDGLQKVEYNKKGRKYRFVNNTFQRIRQEDKHLIIYPENLEEKLSFYSAFTILYNIGEILNQFPDFCCTILGLAQELEKNKWYEPENSSIIHLKNAKYDPRDLKDLADEYITENPINDNHVSMGLNLMIASKLNFLHTDHHIGTKLEGHYMKYFIESYFGEDALLSHDVLIALKSCVHWGNIKGILYKLDVPNIKIDDELRSSFDKFPDPMEELKINVYDRYPSGTSKYSLVKKSLEILSDWSFSKLVPCDLDLDWLFEVCNDIETNPIKYHLRSQTKDLCENPVNLSELNMKYGKLIKKVLEYVSLIINIFEDTGGEFLMQNSKIPKLTPELIKQYNGLYNKLIDTHEQIDNYLNKNWDDDDIIARLGECKNSLYIAVNKYYDE